MVSWEFTGNERFRRRSPENGFGDDFSQWRNSGIPVGRSITTAANSHKLPRRIWENRHESGNPTVLPHNRTRTRKYRTPLLRLSFGAASTPAPTQVKGKAQMPHATASAVPRNTKNPHHDVRCGLSVELGGFEPPTPSMPWRCATSCAIAPVGLQLSGPFFANLVYNTSAACDVKIDHAIGVSFFAKRRAPDIRCARR